MSTCPAPPGRRRRRSAPGPGRPPAPAPRWRAGLYRPLAEDDDRVAYWIRHVRNGVLLSEISAFAVLVYVLLTDSPGRHHPLLLALAGAGHPGRARRCCSCRCRR